MTDTNDPGRPAGAGGELPGASGGPADTAGQLPHTTGKPPFATGRQPVTTGKRSIATGNPLGKPLGKTTPPRRRDSPLFRALGIVLLLAIPVFFFLQWYERYEKRDLVTGARGPFPASTTAGPVAPAHVTHRTTGWDEVAVHGLGVRTTDTGVKAVHLRTGKEYWRYERRDGGEGLTVFTVTPRTVAIWFADGRLVAIDLRTGEPRWDTTSERELKLPSIDLMDGRIITETNGEVRAFSEDDGSHLWTLKAPSHCTDLLLRRNVQDQSDHLSVVEIACQVVPDKDADADAYALLLGLDNRTGDVLWERRTDGLWSHILHGDKDTLIGVLDSPDDDYSVQLFDANREGVRPRAELDADAWDPVASGSGIVLSSTDSKNVDAVHDTTLDAYDTQDGHRAWRLRAPSGRQFGTAGIADGRVYVVRHPIFKDADRGSRVRGELLVLDADNGRVLHTLRLTPMTVTKYGETAVLNVRAVADGTVTIQWNDEDEDLLVVTD